jgi:hypothetical protein
MSLKERRTMNEDSPTNYYLLNLEQVDTCQLESEDILSLPEKLSLRLLPGNGIAIGRWVESEQTGNVSHICIVRSMDNEKSIARVDWVRITLKLKPNPSGRRWWRNAYFRFADSVRERYMLDDIFAENFPEYRSMAFANGLSRSSSTPRSYQEVTGYIYVLRSKYGFKIGKTVNLKDRTRLFEVKLPFKFEIELSDYVDNYSKVEADLHRRYAAKRLEGEWFDLDDNDIDNIRQHLAAA